MKAVIFREHGLPGVLEFTDVPEPIAGPDEVLVRVAATSVNRVDTLVRGGYPGLVIPLPHILGGDIAGTVVRCGANVRGYAAGDRVVSWPLIACGTCDQCTHGKPHICANWQFIGMHRHGGYAEYVSIPAKSLLHLPDAITFEEGASIPTAGIVAMHGLTNVSPIQPGETFFIWGGSSGVGTFAIQIAKQRGATVIATAGSPEKMEVARQCGADHVLNHHTDDIMARVMEITHGLGIDAIIDYVGPATFSTSFAMTKKGGRIMLCGILTGREATVSLHMTYLQHKSILGIYLGTKDDMQALLDLVAAKKVKPVIFEAMPLHNAEDAHRMMQELKHYGKIVLKP
jgi:NADPH:quinone reductase-like Zn-dependent oxidoreductase